MLLALIAVVYRHGGEDAYIKIHSIGIKCFFHCFRVFSGCIMRAFFSLLTRVFMCVILQFFLKLCFLLFILNL